MPIEKTFTEADTYDRIVTEVAKFTGAFVGIMTRYTASKFIPQHDSYMKNILHESANIILSSTIAGLTTYGIQKAGQKLKPYICRK